jgi:hypothetical protein
VKSAPPIRSNPDGTCVRFRKHDGQDDSAVGAGFGAMTLAGKLLDVDAMAVTAAALVGLALGVAFSLMIYVRWRDELRAEPAGDPAAAAPAALATMATAGRAVLIGGTALALALILASQLGPTEIVVSLGVGVLLCSLLAIGASVVVMPAVLVIGGTRLEAYAFGVPRLARAAWARLTGAGTGWSAGQRSSARWPRPCSPRCSCRRSRSTRGRRRRRCCRAAIRRARASSRSPGPWARAGPRRSTSWSSPRRSR